MSRTCRRCLYTTNHPLGLDLDGEEVCRGCRVHEEKTHLDWNSRWQELRKLVAGYRSLDGRSYDCIVPVSGGQDSFFVMHLVRNRLGLNPLAVAYNSHFSSREGFRNLARLREVFNSPLHMKTVKPSAIRRIVRASLATLGSVHWHTLAGQRSFAVQLATRMKIPLVIWGAHQGTEQVGMYSHLDNVEMTRRSWQEHDLLGCEPDNLLSPWNDLNEADIAHFRYPSEQDLLAVGVRGIYLSNYFPWDPTRQHRFMVDRYKYRSSVVPRTFDPYEHVDSLVYMGIHDWLKFEKHGYTRVTDHVVREIRHGRISREAGRKLVLHYSEQGVPWLPAFATWLGADMRAIRLAVKRQNSKWLSTVQSSIAQEEVPLPGSVGLPVDFVWDKPSELSALSDEDTFVLLDRGYPN